MGCRNGKQCMAGSNMPLSIEGHKSAWYPLADMSGCRLGVVSIAITSPHTIKKKSNSSREMRTDVPSLDGAGGGG